MIKFLGTNKDKVVIGIGLAHDDIVKLMNGQPFMIAPQELGLKTDLEILLIAGATDIEIVDGLQEFMGGGQDDDK
jgi:hypothetical protein